MSLSHLPGYLFTPYYSGQKVYRLKQIEKNITQNKLNEIKVTTRRILKSTKCSKI